MKNVERGMYRFTIMTGQEKTVGSGYDFWRVCRSLHQRYEAETKTQYLADKGAYSTDEVIAIF